MPADCLGDKREASPLTLVCAWYSEPPLFTGASLVLKAAQKGEFLDLLPRLLLRRRHTRGGAGLGFGGISFIFFGEHESPKCTQSRVRKEKKEGMGKKKPSNLRKQSVFCRHLLPSLLHPQGEGVERFKLHQVVSNAAGGSCSGPGSRPPQSLPAPCPMLRGAQPSSRPPLLPPLPATVGMRELPRQ